MKKLLTLLLIIIVLTGCSKYNYEKNEYTNSIKELNDIKESSNKYPFNLEVVLDKLTDKEVRYQVILDNVEKNLDDVSMIAIHNKKTSDIYPSIGIFDEKENLKVNKRPSGIILVGYIRYSGDIEDIDATFKVLVKYKIEGKEYKVHYMTKK